MTESQLLAGRYRLDSLLGQGGMGQVHAGFDTLLERKVAIKTLPETSELDAQARARFRREARAAAALDHPFICKVYEVGEEGGKAFIVMEFIDGRTLDAVIADGALTSREVLEIANEITQALDEAHRQNIVHRDLKPSNIMRDVHGHVKVLDFGLAKQTAMEDDATTRLTPAVGDTRPGTRLGTPSYMSPEQVLGTPLDPRSDVFSLGIVLHQLASGRHPFLKDTPSETMAAILRDEPGSTPGDLDVVPGFGHMVHRMLAKACAARFQTMRDVRGELDAMRESTPGSTPRSASLAALALPQERTPFVARDAELAELNAHLDRMLLGQGNLILLGGEPGVGKTRLAREIQRVARQRGCIALTGQCYEQEGAPPYGPFVETMSESIRAVPQAVRGAMGDLAAEMTIMLPDLRRTFPDIPPLADVAPEQKRRMLFDAYLIYAQRASSKSAGVVLLDDLHWADDASVQLLLHVASHLQRLRLLVIGTYRDVDLNAKRPFAKALETLLRQRLATRISVKRLNPSGVNELLTTMSGARPPESFARVVYEETEGNPFFVEEVFQHLREEGRLFDEQGRWKSSLRAEDIDVPEGVKLVVSRRVERLGEQARTVLTAAAVIGRSFALDILEAVAGASGDEVLVVVEEAERAQLLQAERGREARYSFVHELIRTTLLGELSLPRRQRLHLRVADAIDARRAGSIDVHAAALAHHLYQAGAAVDQGRAIAAIVRAMLAARSAGAFEEALEFADQLASPDFAPDDQTRLLVGEIQVDGLLALGRVPEALAAAERYVAQAMERGDDASKAAAALRLVRIATWAGRPAQTIATVERALNGLSPESHRARAELQAAYSGVLNGVGRMREAWTAAEQAHVAATHSGDPAALAVALNVTAIVNMNIGRPAASLETAERALGLVRDSRHATAAQAALQKASMLVCCGRLGELDEFLPEAERIAKRVGFSIGVWTIEMWRMCAALQRTGDLPACRAHAERLARHNPPNILANINDTFIAAVDLYRGAVDDAMQRLRQTMNAAYGASGIIHHANLFAALAWSGRADEARALWRDIEPVVLAGSPDFDGWRGMSGLQPAAAALMLLGESAACAALYPALEKLPALGWASPFPIMIGPTSPQLALAISADAGGLTDRAREHFEEALRLAHTVPDRLLQPTVRMWFGRFLAARSEDEHTRGLALLQTAADDFISLGMPLHHERARGWRADA